MEADAFDTWKRIPCGLKMTRKHSCLGQGVKLSNVVCSGVKAVEVGEFQFHTADKMSGQPHWQYYPRSSKLW